jgi:predicted nucleotidyltransferase component of viral defense system
MLQTKTIEPATLSLLKKLMQIAGLDQFNLVGGTALSLQYGHRLSIDLDLFSTTPFDNDNTLQLLETIFKNELRYESSHPKFGIFCYINDIKVDIVYNPHPLIDTLIEEEGIRMLSSKDLAAMKINAVLGRGRKKDFWDLAELFQHYSLQQIIEFYEKKYPSQQLLVSIPQAISYFADADESEAPVSLKKQTWPSVKKIIKQKVGEYLK